MAEPNEKDLLDYTSAIFTISTCEIALSELEKKANKKKRLWSKAWKMRKHKNMYSSLLTEMRVEDRLGETAIHRMSTEMFFELLRLVTPLIKKQDTKLREAVPPEQRLSLTLRYLATGKYSTVPEYCTTVYH